MINQNKNSLLKRLSRIEGQVRGIARMVEGERYCMDMLTQIAAVRGALAKVEDEIIKDHVSHCVENAIVSGDPEQQRAKVTELVTALGRMKR